MPSFSYRSVVAPVVILVALVLPWSNASEPKPGLFRQVWHTLFGAPAPSSANDKTCPQCNGPLVPQSSSAGGVDPSPYSAAPSISVIPSAGSSLSVSSMSEEGRLALERERTEQLKVIVAGQVAEGHDRGRWTATITELIEQRRQESDDKTQQFLVALLQKHHQFLEDLEDKRGEQEVKKEEVRQKNLPALLPQLFEHDRQKADQLHGHTMEKLKYLGDGISAFTRDKERLALATTAGCFLALGVYVAKRGTKVGAEWLAARLMQPVLVSETSKLTLSGIMRNPIRSLRRRNFALPTALYNAELQESVDNYIAAVTIRAQRGLAPRNALFHGVPGVGKTLIAKTIARATGKHYAIVPGANLSQYSGAQAIQQMNQLMRWAEANQAVLFFDEIDAWGKRRDTAISEMTCQLQNTFYGLTGTGQERFLIIGATNNPESLDPALLSRLNEWIYFDLPNNNTRYKLIQLYLTQELEQHGIETSMPGKPVHLEWAAQMTEGLSGRDIQAIARTLHDAVRIKGEMQLSPALFRKVIQDKVQQKSKLHAQQ